jgi:hypothetical protein
VFALLGYFKQKFWIFEWNYTMVEERLDFALFGDGYHASCRVNKEKASARFSFVSKVQYRDGISIETTQSNLVFSNLTRDRLPKSGSYVYTPTRYLST